MPGAGTKAKIASFAKAAAKKDHHTPASLLVDSAFKKVAPHHNEILPNLQYIERATNRIRAKERPEHPRDLNFILDEYNIPENFVKKDISRDGQRYLILGTDLQFELFSKAKVIFFDATFKSVKKPFKQMASFHTFVESKGKMKQVPLCFIIMSRRQRSDYKAVLEAILNLLPSKPVVKEVILDFERAMWGAFRRVLPTVNLHGCWFHWAQAVYRKVKGAGLKKQYAKNHSIRSYIRQLMALPHLPGSHIPEAFAKLKSRTTSDKRIKKVLTYIENKWVNSIDNPPSSWSNFERTIRTNNDVTRLDHHIRGINYILYMN